MTVFLENRALLNAFREGRPEALRTVYLLYVDQIISLLKTGFTDKSTCHFIRGVRDPERQRELLQEVFIRAFSKNARLAYDGLRPYRTYLTTIAGNIIIDAWRADRRDPLSDARRAPEETHQRSVSEAGEDGQQEGDSEEMKLHWRRCLQESDRYVASLDVLSQEFVRFRFQEGLPQRDVAKRLKLTRSKVRTMERRIRGELRKHLRQCGLLEKQ